MSCLANSRGEFCLIVEQQWDVDSLDQNGHATWPAYTEKIYPDFSEGDYEGSPAEDVDGTLIDLSDDPIMWPKWLSQQQVEESGEDYFLEPISLDWRGHGHDLPLEYDEYPLEIQSSECFLAQYRYGIESKWGEVYDEVSDQVWNNIRRNCNLDCNLCLRTIAVHGSPHLSQFIGHIGFLATARLNFKRSKPRLSTIWRP
ncbi:hypothetical protein KC356_g8771 [Hortaea werneckii]|nr:hypothetical protein KC356_g8771 [Hortaea werneckii]